MTPLTLVLRSLLRRPARTALTAAGVALGVGLIVALLSITAGVRRTADDLIHVGRADFGLFQRGASDLTRSVLPASLLQRVARDPGVDDVAGIFLLVNREQLVLGYAADEFPAQRLVLTSGRAPRRREAIVGDRATLDGDTLRIGLRRFRVVGRYHTGNSFVDRGAVLPLSVVQSVAERPDEVTTIAVTVKVGHAPNDVAERLQREIPGVVAVVEPGQAVKIDTSSRLITTAGWVFSLLALIVGGIGVTNTMAMSVFERTREIGIMRAVGWPARRIASLIVGEALAIGALALGVGLLGGWIAAEVLTDRGTFADLVEAEFTAGVVLWGLAFALGVGLLGALYPAWRAVSLTPIEALRRE